MKGVFTAMITPFTKDGKSIDFENLKKQIEFQISGKVAGVVLLGTTGESCTMTLKEKIKFLKFAIKQINHRIKVIVGIGGNDTNAVISFMKNIEKLDIDAYLAVTPYYNKCTQDGLVCHYTSIANHSTKPIILYNVPGRTGVNLEPQTVKILAKHKNIIGIKEASGKIDQIVDISKFVNQDFYLYSGDDGIVVPVLSMGGSGVISVASNILPQQMVEMCDLWFNGKIRESKQVQLEMRDFIKALFIEVNPMPIKSIMKLEQMDSGCVRLPLTSVKEETNKILLESYCKLIKRK